MINIEDRNYIPNLDEIKELINTKTFEDFNRYLIEKYEPKICIEYSGDKVLLGWNVKYKKSGKTLCTIYPRINHFPLLLIVGRKEKEQVENKLIDFSNEFVQKYNSTLEGMGQRWLVFDINDNNDLLENIKEVIEIRKNNK